MAQRGKQRRTAAHRPVHSDDPSGASRMPASAPPRPNRLLLAVSIVLLVVWSVFLIAMAIVG